MATDTEDDAGPRERYLTDVRRGDMVRLLAAHYDGWQLLQQGAVVRWWNDTPPSAQSVERVEASTAGLKVPVMGDGIPPADYIDPATGQKPVIG